MLKLTLVKSILNISIALKFSKNIFFYINFIFYRPLYIFFAYSIISIKRSMIYFSMRKYFIPQAKMIADFHRSYICFVRSNF